YSALVTGCAELVGDRVPLVGQLPPPRPLDVLDHFLDDLVDLGTRAGVARVGDAGLRGVQRLRALAPVTVDRDRLRAEPPRLDVSLLDLLDRRVLRHVDGLRDRARNQRL